MTPTKYLKAQKILQDATKRQLEASQVEALMGLYQHPEGMNLGELGRMLGISQASAGRTAALFAQGARDSKNPGWNLAELYYDPRQPRSTMIRLNSRGRHLIEDFLEALE